jgi:hypothetical protein
MQPNADRVNSCPVTVNSFLAVIGAIVLMLQAAACIPAALAELLRACAPIFTAWAELRTACHGSGTRRRLYPCLHHPRHATPTKRRKPTRVAGESTWQPQQELNGTTQCHHLGSKVTDLRGLRTVSAADVDSGTRFRPGSRGYSHWSRPDHTHVCSMFARMSRYGPVAAGTRRHRILKGAARSGTSWHDPALADTG